MPHKSKYGRPIAYHRSFVGVTGSVNAAVMLSQAVYWSERTTDPEGWFWKTQEEWQEETGLTRYEQEGARGALKKTGFWAEERRGIPARMFYKVAEDDLDDAVEEWIARDELANDIENSLDAPLRKRKNSGQVRGKVAAQIAENQHSSMGKNHILDAVKTTNILYTKTTA